MSSMIIFIILFYALNKKNNDLQKGFFLWMIFYKYIFLINKKYKKKHAYLFSIKCDFSILLFKCYLQIQK